MDKVEEPLIYNTILINPFISLFKYKYPHVNIEDILNFARIDVAQVGDPLVWLTQRQINDFCDRLRLYFDNPQYIAREAGHFIYSDKSLGLFKKFTLKLLTVGYLFQNASKYGASITKVQEYTSRKLASNKYEITCRIKPGVVEHELQEHNRLGCLEAAPLLFSDHLGKIESRRDGNTTTYTVTWEKPKSEIFAKIKLSFFLSSLLIVPLTWHFYGPHLAVNMTGLYIMGGLILVSLQYRHAYRELKRAFHIQETSSEHILKKFIDDYDQVFYLNKVGRIVIKHNIIDKFLDDIHKLLKELGYAKVAFFINGFKGDHIAPKGIFGFSEGLQRLKIRLEEINKTDAYAKPMFIRSLHGRPDSKVIDFSLFHPDDFPIVLTPIIFDRTVFGLLVVSPAPSLLPMGIKKNDFLSGVASQIALGVNKTFAYQELVELVESDKLKSDFISTASHELKTPLQILMMGLNDLEATSNLQDNLPIMKSVVDKLNQIVNTFLNLQSIESNKYSLDVQAFQARELFLHLQKEMLSSSKIYVHETKFALEGYDDLADHINCDIDKISMAVINLFNNSCKFTPIHGTILFKLENRPNEHLFSVIDNGYGIPKHAHAKVFIKFFQADSLQSKVVGGCGLGLSISKEIVKLHGGDITIESPLAESEYADLELGAERLGTRVDIHLPKAPQV